MASAAPVNGDTIYNGAMDDASGIASVIETARLLKASGVKTKRSVIFLAVTAEEKGVLGSRYFADHPTVPFKQIVADINLDMFLPLYALKVIEVQGLTESSLGDSVRAAAEVARRRRADRSRARAEPLHPQRPVQLHPPRRAGAGVQVRLRVRLARRDDPHAPGCATCYHKPSDDLNQPVDLEAAALFNRVIMTLLQRVANDPTRPTWNADSFFKRFATGR